MSEPYRLFGREVKAYQLREKPNVLLVDVLQNERDCPRKLPVQARYVCPLDCGNSFVNVFYDYIDEKVLGTSALIKADSCVNYASTLVEFGLPTQGPVSIFLDILRTIQPEEFTVRETPYGEDLFYKGHRVSSKGPCRYLAEPGRVLDTDHPELSQYFDHIVNNIWDVLEKCGVSVVEEGGDKKLVIPPESIKSAHELNLVGRLSSN